MTGKMKVISLFLALFAAGCQLGEPSVSPDGKTNIGVQEIRLHDGTRCVVVRAEAISCDWRSMEDFK